MVLCHPVSIVSYILSKITRDNYGVAMISMLLKIIGLFCRILSF